METSPANFLEIALPLIDRFSIIPLPPRSKAANGVGALSRTRDRQTVEQWAVAHPDGNVAIVADDEIVILETDDLGRFTDLIKNGTGQDLPTTLMACGSSPDRPHLFFKRTAKATNVGNLQVPGLFEARFSNQYVVAAGSVHPDGSIYRWLNEAPIAEIPDWLVSELARLALSQKNDRKNPLVQAGPDGRIGEGGRHYFLMREGGKLWNGKVTVEELADQLIELDLKHCEPPKGEAHCQQCARDLVKRDPYDPGPKVLPIGRPAELRLDPTTHTDGGAFNSLLGPHGGSKYGVLNTRRVHVISGNSGAGKTIWTNQMLVGQLEDRSFFDRAGAGWPFLSLWADRGEDDITEQLTVLDMMKYRRWHTAVSTSKSPAQTVADALVASTHDPKVVFLEGVDLWVEDSTSKRAVAKHMEELRAVATHHDVSIVLSVGSQKFKPKEQYAHTRARVSGADAWVRMAHTCINIAEDPKDGIRTVTIDARTGPKQVVDMKFGEDGRLHIHQPAIDLKIDAPPDSTREEAVFHFLDQYPSGDMEKTFGMKESTARNWRARWRKSRC